MPGADAAHRFAATYTRMLPARVERINQALDDGDDHQAMDAVLSLKISSAMVGALQMEQHCARLEDALARTDRTGAAAAGEDVTRHQAELEKVLRVPGNKLLPVQALDKEGCSTPNKTGTLESNQTH
ncbi:Hpt domain-containing protein [Arthrobacter sp. GN70]|uniref:HPt domain-containing protein n=2 Tax=Arthrobacter TaxID=1663 RepID=A0A4V2ZUN7_9MICC|nr:Hpt domain-containing protein [Arthrobacter sp. GN70]TDG01465.1 hypothetical protein E1809_01680 [Arthrobacter terricola]